MLGEPFADLFKQQIGRQPDRRPARPHQRPTPTEVILFEVAKERDTRKVTERIAELMYTVLLRELDYAEDFDIAELEIELEAEGKLDQFVTACKKLHKLEWRMVRKGAQKLSRASAVLHDLDPTTYPAADSWAHSQRNRDAAITVSKVVERTFELVGRRRHGKALVFIIDEVGQHVARSGDKIEDLRATVEEFGKVGKNLLKANARSPPRAGSSSPRRRSSTRWSSALGDDKRIDLAKLQDRFRHRVDLAPSDIREVATKRVLAKKPTRPSRRSRSSSPRIRARSTPPCGWSGRPARTEITEADFVQFYPYPPHYIDLCIGIMSGIRLQPGAPRHYGGSNRTIIKQAYEMLVSERTAVRQASPSARWSRWTRCTSWSRATSPTRSAPTSTRSASGSRTTPTDQGWALRVAKAVCLLEFIRDLPRTEANIAAFLVDEVGKPAPLDQVQGGGQAARRGPVHPQHRGGLEAPDRPGEELGRTERRSYLEPKPRERNEITRQALREIFGEPALKTYRYKDYRNFRIGVSVEGTQLGDEGDLPLTLCIADDADDFPSKLDEVREESRQKRHENDLYWVFALTPEIDELVAQLHASRKMVEKYDQIRGAEQDHDRRGRLPAGREERGPELPVPAAGQARRGDGAGHRAVPGRVPRTPPSLGKGLGEILRKLLGHAVPDLYPKLEWGPARSRGRGRAILKAADLKALPPRLLRGRAGPRPRDQGRGEVRRRTPAADVAKEVLDYLVGEHGYGNKESRTGKALEKRFGGIGYGWDRDMLRLVLAVLFRAGSIEVTHGGEKFAAYQDPAAARRSSTTTAFKSALFTPVKPIDLQTLKRAVESYEDLTGETVDVDKGGHRDGPQEVRRRGDEAGPAGRGPGQGPPPAGPRRRSRSTGTRSPPSSRGRRRLRDHPGGRRGVAQAGARPGSQDRRVPRREGPRDLRQRPAGGGRDLEPPRSPGTGRPPAEGRGTEGAARLPRPSSNRCNRSGRRARRSSGAYRQAVRVPPRRPGRAVPGGDREDQGAGGVDRRARDDAGPVLAPLRSRCCDEPEAAGRRPGVRDVPGRAEPDGVGRGGAGRLFAQVVAQIQKLITPPETKPRAAGAGRRVLRRGAGDEEQVKQAVARLQDHLLKLLDEGVKIVVE